MAKLESSRALAAGSVTDVHTPNGVSAAASPPAEEAPIERPRSSAQKSVHFAADEPDVIPPSETYPQETEEEEEEESQSHASMVAADGSAAVVLYDFNADGEDELSVHEGETLVVLERDSDEWWKCRNAHGAEGVVPASYVEVGFGFRRIVYQVLSHCFVACGRCRAPSSCP